MRLQLILAKFSEIYTYISLYLYLSYTSSLRSLIAVAVRERE